MIFGYHALDGAYETPMRVVGANIYFEWLLYPLALIPVGIFLYGLYQHVRSWLVAKGSVNRTDYMVRRVWRFIIDTLFQRKIVKGKPFMGFMHGLVFWGFLILAIVTALYGGYANLHLPVIEGKPYIWISVFADILGLLATIGIIVLSFNRYVLKPLRLDDTRRMDGWVLTLVFLTLITGYGIESLRIAAQMINETAASGSLTALSYERYSSPVGWPLAYLLSSMPLETLLSWHRIMWWVHVFLAFTFIAVMPFTKLWHILAGLLNFFVRNFAPSQARMVENIEEAETFGVENIEEFTWKDLLDLDACVRCGRCQDVCPAFNTGKPLNPKVTLIQSMKNHFDQKAPLLVENQRQQRYEEASSAQTVTAMTTTETATERPGLQAYRPEPGTDPMEVSLIYDVVTPEVLWSCTNCRACMQECPMYIEHIDKVVDMRRNLVMWQGDMPLEAQNAFTNMERNYNPWGVGWANRADWLTERGVREYVNLLPEEDGEDFEYLLYGGCAVAFDDRFKRVGAALVTLLHKANIKVAYLGTEEQCCGDSARRLGNEYLYQTLAAQNIEAFNQYGVKKIICICPHGYNTLKNEYPQMNGVYEVYHYTEILAQLLQSGALQADAQVQSRLSYHDSCFLGRHNDIYEPPRAILRAAGGQIMEIEKSRERSFCCGAGGGRMWLEEQSAENFKRINETRTDQLLEKQPDFIATNCPFCLTMIDDGVKGCGKEEEVKVVDVAEFLLRHLKED